MILRPKNWTTFQHYKDRCPPWVKLHRALLDDYEYSRLPLASKAIAPLLWLIAAESKDGDIKLGRPALAFRLHITEKELDSGLKPLIDSGFFIMMQGASNPLAECLHDATPEREAERETESDAPKRATRFPDGFRPNENNKSVADEQGVSLEREMAQFKDHHLSRGTKMLNWNLGLNTWLRNANKFAPQKRTDNAPTISAYDTI